MRNFVKLKNSLSNCGSSSHNLNLYCCREVDLIHNAPSVESKQKLEKKKTSHHFFFHPNPASKRCAEGMASPSQGLAAAATKTRQAARQHGFPMFEVLPCNIRADSCARAFAMALKKSAVRPPTSAAKTTRRVIRPALVGWVYVCSFALRAACKATSLVVVAFRRAETWPCKGDAGVVSTANQRDNPSTTTSTRRPSI